MLHLLGRKSEEADKQHQSIGFRQNRDCGQVGDPCLNFALLGHTKNNRTIKSSMNGQNPGKGRNGFFRTVFVITGNQDQMLSFAGSFRSLVKNSVCKSMGAKRAQR